MSVRVTAVYARHLCCMLSNVNIRTRARGKLLPRRQWKRTVASAHTRSKLVRTVIQSMAKHQQWCKELQCDKRVFMSGRGINKETMLLRDASATTTFAWAVSVRSWLYCIMIEHYANTKAYALGIKCARTAVLHIAYCCASDAITSTYRVPLSPDGSEACNSWQGTHSMALLGLGPASASAHYTASAQHPKVGSCQAVQSSSSHPC